MKRARQHVNGPTHHEILLIIKITKAVDHTAHFRCLHSQRKVTFGRQVLQTRWLLAQTLIYSHKLLSNIQPGKRDR